MKKTVLVILAASLFALAAPVLAEEMHQHGAPHQTQDEQCARECDLLLKDCAQEVDSIHDRIQKLQSAIKEKGADTYTQEELKLLKRS